jgi:hypothetical protein
MAPSGHPASASSPTSARAASLTYSPAQERYGTSFFPNIEGPELLNKYVSETQRHVHRIF